MEESKRDWRLQLLLVLAARGLDALLLSDALLRLPVDDRSPSGRREDLGQEKVDGSRDDEADGPDEGRDVGCRTRDRCHLRSSDRSNETGQVGNCTEDEGNDSTHVETARVPVLAGGRTLVYGGDVEVPLFDNPLVGDHDSGDGGEEDGVAGEERRERLCTVLDIPGRTSETDDGADVLSSSDVDVLGEEDGELQ